MTRSRDLHNWMWAEALTLLDEAERLRRQFFRLAEGATVRAGSEGAAAPSWEPPVDVIETADALLVVIALPGVAVDDVAITLGAGMLTVSAQRAFPACDCGARIHRVEIPYGRFERRIALPTRALELTDRSLRAGCLKLTFRKMDEDAA